MYRKALTCGEKGNQHTVFRRDESASNEVVAATIVGNRGPAKRAAEAARALEVSPLTSFLFTLRAF